MGKNRDRLSIVAAILEATNSGASKTRIMFQANLNFCLLEKYLDVATESGFLSETRSKYSLTRRGHAFLKEYRYFHDRYVRAQETLQSLQVERERLARLCHVYDLAGSVECLTDAE